MNKIDNYFFIDMFIGESIHLVSQHVWDKKNVTD